MKLSVSRRFARDAALVAVAALLLGVGAFGFWSDTGAEIPTTAAGSHVAQKVDGPPLNGNQLVVLGWEESDKDPVNAVLLLASSLVAGWQLAYYRRQPATCLPGIPGRPSFEAAREDASFLSVFRL